MKHLSQFIVGGAFIIHAEKMTVFSRLLRSSLKRESVFIFNLKRNILSIAKSLN